MNALSRVVSVIFLLATSIAQADAPTAPQTLPPLQAPSVLDNQSGVERACDANTDLYSDMLSFVGADPLSITLCPQNLDS